MRTIRPTVLSALSAIILGAASPSQSAPVPGMNMVMAPMPSAYAGEADKPGAPIFTGLGAHHHKITTHNPKVQALFDQGVNLIFGFNHAEAIRSFREAARLDPGCAMCWWGVAFALGPNINMSMPPDAVTPAWQALQKAQAIKSRGSLTEQAWIDALAVRYAPAPPSDRRALDEAFAQAMKALWQSHPEDLDAGTFYVESLMDTQPWDYWQPDGKSPKGHGGDIVAILENIMATAPDHPGALHLYIHAVEASTTPQRAEAAADRLLKLMPGAGHIVHMPSHIYYRVGRYADADRANENAAKVDEAYIATCRAQGFYPTGYYGHNIHFLWTSSEMQGRYQASLDAARRLVKAVNPEAGAATTRALELYAFTPMATLLRFGKYPEILAEPTPPAALKLESAIALYARGFAHANTVDHAAAAADRAELSKLVAGDWTAYAASGVPAHAMANLALALLDGEIARTGGNISDAVARFQLALRLEESLPYTEPAYWHQPVSHLLGAALIQSGQAHAAEMVYRTSLETYRRDGWAYWGLSKALHDQGRQAEADEANKAFTEAWSRSDVTLTQSRF